MGFTHSAQTEKCDADGGLNGHLRILHIRCSKFKAGLAYGSRLTLRWGKTAIEDFQSRFEFPQRSFPDHVQLQLSSKMSRRRKMQTKRITSEATRADTTCLWVTSQPAQDCCDGLAIMK